MKKLATALMFFCVTTYAQSADWVARIANQAGGHIIFMTLKGSCQHGKAVYGSTSSGLTTWGCWVNSDNHVLVFWNEGQTRTSAFPYSVLEINPAFDNKNNQENKGSTF